MTAGLLDFFILEASDCVERLDGLLARAAGGPPDPDLFARDARALRGSATMAKVQGIADVAAGIERVAKGLRDRSISWGEPLKAALVAAIDDLKILVHGVRTWGSDEERRASERAAELRSLAPAPARRSAVSPAAAGGSAGFLAAETSEIASQLLRFAGHTGTAGEFLPLLERVRALRGVAALNDLPPLAEVVAAVDDAAKPVELGATSLTDAQRALFRCAAAVLREGSDAVHRGERPDPRSTTVDAFTSAAAQFFEAAGDADQVVPIASLFPDGAGPNIVHAATNPPTTAARRFKLEIVSQAEHLRRLVSDARGAADTVARRRLGHELRGAVRALARAAAGFGEDRVARALLSLADGAALLEGRALAALDEASVLLTSPGDSPVGPRFDALAADAGTVAPATESLPSITDFAPSEPVAAAPARTTPTTAAPSGTALHEMLGAGIAGLAGLETETLSEPAPVDDDGTVPIQELLFRGRAALTRAVEISDALRRAAGTPDAESLAELYDLLELASAE